MGGCKQDASKGTAPQRQLMHHTAGSAAVDNSMSTRTHHCCGGHLWRRQGHRGRHCCWRWWRWRLAGRHRGRHCCCCCCGWLRHQHHWRRHSRRCHSCLDRSRRRGCWRRARRCRWFAASWWRNAGARTAAAAADDPEAHCVAAAAALVAGDCQPDRVGTWRQQQPHLGALADAFEAAWAGDAPLVLGDAPTYLGLAGPPVKGDQRGAACTAAAGLCHQPLLEARRADGRCGRRQAADPVARSQRGAGARRDARALRLRALPAG